MELSETPIFKTSHTKELLQFTEFRRGHHSNLFSRQATSLWSLTTQFKARRNLHKLPRFYFCELQHLSKFFELCTYITLTPLTKFDKLAGEALKPLNRKLEIAFRTRKLSKQVAEPSHNSWLVLIGPKKEESAWENPSSSDHFSACLKNPKKTSKIQFRTEYKMNWTWWRKLCLISKESWFRGM